MAKCGDIRAYYRREERYEGLQLVYGESSELKDEILKAIESVKNRTGLSPAVFENVNKDDLSKQAIYMEFNDDYFKDGGEFFEELLKELQIDECQ